MRFLPDNVGIGLKLYANAAIVLILFGITAGYALSSMNQIAIELEAIVEQDIPLTGAITLILALPMYCVPPRVVFPVRLVPI